MAKTKQVKKAKINTDCFVIMPISDQDGYPPGHFTKVYEDIIREACYRCKLTPFRGDDTSEANVIHVDIVKRLIASKLAICDLSSRNPNVMFELGIRQAYGLPTVLISDTATQRIFDVDLIRCVYYDQCLEYRAVLDAQNRVEQAIKDTLNSKDVESGSIVSLAKAKFAEMPNLTSAVSRSKNAMKPIMQRLDSLEDGLERIASMCQRQGRIAVPGLDDESVRSASRKGCWVIRA